MAVPDPAVPLSVSLFGPFDVRVQGRPLLPLRSRKGQWLLALLTLRHGRAVERAWLAGSLWPDAPEEQALASLRQSLADLRSALGPEAHRLRSPNHRTLSLDLDGAVVDLLAFDRAAARGDAPSLQEAVALYAGPLLEGCHEEWVVPEREAREQRYLQALEALAQDARSRGDMEAAVAHLRRAVAVDPLREDTQRALLEALGDAGRYGEVLEAYRALRRLLLDEVRAEPAPETRALYERIRAQARWRAREAPAQLPRPAAPPPCHLPRPLTELVGREQEVQEVASALGRARLVTLVGSGGVGKTRLAIRAAEEALDDFPDGAWFVDLAALSDPGLVAQAAAGALGVRDSPGRPLVETLCEYLQEKALLLVLDNCEHVVGECARVAEALLRECRLLRVLATSREPLRLFGEVAYRTPSLSVPEAGGLPEDREALVAAVARSEAGRLFDERAKAVEPTFAVGQANARSVAEICRRLDGIPLALEMAAARVGAVPVELIARRLDNGFRTLMVGSRTALPRQHTLRATMDWSYQLLTLQERLLLQRLSVFVGGCTLEAAEAACAGSGLEFRDVLPVLTALVDKSLVIYQSQPDEARYRLLGTIRQYAWEHLNASGEHEAVCRRHAGFFAAWADKAHSHASGPEEEAWLARMDLEHANMRAAMDWSLSGGDGGQAGLRLVGLLSWFWYVRCYASEGQAWLQRALAHGDPRDRAGRARALHGAGLLAHYRGEFAESRAFYEGSAALWEQVGDRWQMANTLEGLGHTLNAQGDWQASVAVFERSLALLRELGDDGGVGVVLAALAHVAKDQGDLSRAAALCEESLPLLRAAGDKRSIAGVLLRLAQVLSTQGEREPAAALVSESLELHREIGNPRGTSEALETLGYLARAGGRLDEAERLTEESLRIRREIGDGQCTAASLIAMAEVAFEAGRYERARAFYEDGLRIYREIHQTLPAARALSGLAGVVCAQGEPHRAAALVGEAIETQRELGDRSGLADALRVVAMVARTQRRWEAAREAYTESLLIAREMGLKPRMADALIGLGNLAHDCGQPEAAASHYEESLQLYRELKDMRGAANVLLRLAQATRSQDPGAQVAGLVWEALALHREAGDRGGMARALAHLVVAYQACGETALAARLVGALDALVGSAPVIWEPSERAEYEAATGAIAGSMGSEALASALAEGRAMDLDEAVSLALGKPADA